MPEDEGSYRNYINSSGFAFQLGVEEEIRSSKSEHGWDLVAREHFWSLDEDTEGYADILIENGNVRLIIECKRQAGKNWVFLVDSDLQNSVMPMLWAVTANPYTGDHRGRSAMMWDRFGIKPQCYESAFCTMQGQSGHDRPLLERTASESILSVEGIAAQESARCETLNENDDWIEKSRIYGGVIITTAKLVACITKGKDVDVIEGKLKDDGPRFETVKWIKFKKALKSTIEQERDRNESLFGLARINKQQERGVFVVNSEFIGEFLKNFAMANDRITQAYYPAVARMNAALEKLQREV